MDSVAKSRALRPSWMVEEDTDVPASVPAPLAANMSADANGGGPMVGADGAALVPSSNFVPHSAISTPLGGEMGGGEMSAVPMGGATGPAASVKVQMGPLQARFHFANVQNFSSFFWQLVPAFSGLQASIVFMNPGGPYMTHAQPTAITGSSSSMVPHQTQPPLQMVSSSVPQSIPDPRVQWFPPRFHAFLPREGWKPAAEFWVHIPELQLEDDLYEERRNVSVMHGFVEYVFAAQPVFNTLPELCDIQIWEQGKLVDFSTYTKWHRLGPVVGLLRSRILHSSGRRRTIDEVFVRKWVPQDANVHVVPMIMEYLWSLVEQAPPANPTLLVHWTAIAQILDISDTVHRVQSVEVKDLNPSTGPRWAIIVWLDQPTTVRRPDAFSHFFWIAHNTTFEASVHLLATGHFRPTRYQIADPLWQPPISFYTRAHPYQLWR